MQPEHIPACCADGPVSSPERVLWNDEPFQLIAAPHRSAKIVRTKVVSPKLQRQYNETGWPRELVIMWEYSLKLPGDGLTLKLVTNADEAEDEMPDHIQTPLRDSGTYRDALVTWRGRPVKAFVSARLTLGAVAPHRHATPVAHVPHSPQGDDLPNSVLKAGLVIPPQGLLEAMLPEEREFANLLISPHTDGGIHPLSKIATHYGVSDETIRRRKLALEKKYPPLKGVFSSFRARNAKGLIVPPPTLFGRPLVGRSGTEDDGE